MTLVGPDASFADCVVGIGRDCDLARQGRLIMVSEHEHKTVESEIAQFLARHRWNWLLGPIGTVDH